MARGYPDFFGYSTFLKYGILTFDTYVNAAVANLETVTPFNFNMKGKLYSALFRITLPTWLPVGAEIGLSIDGGATDYWPLETIWLQHAVKEKDNWIHIIVWNVELKRVFCACSQELTFDSNLSIYFHNTTGAACSIYGRMYVARII